MITASAVSGAAGADYYCGGGQEAPNAESYYLDAVLDGEPPGRWYGAGAEALGLSGEVLDEEFRAVFGEYLTPQGQRIGRPARHLSSVAQRLADALTAEPGALPERREEIRREVEREAGSVTTGYDFTFSPVKSISVMHTAAHRVEIAALRAGDVEGAERARQVRVGIEQATEAASRAALDYLSSVSVSRVGRHGGRGTGGTWMRAPGLVAAQFRQHTNRNIDPQLHVHAPVLNRVRCADGQWRAADFKDLLLYQKAAGAIAAATLREHLAQNVGLGAEAWELRENGAYELRFATPQVCRLWSSRDQQITSRMAAEVAAARELFGGRELTPMELAKLHELVTLDTRRGKSHAPETITERMERWKTEVLSIGQDLEAMYEALDTHRATRDAAATGTVAAAAAAGTTDGDATGTVTWSASTVIAEAIAACGEEQATFRRSDLTAEILRRLPAVLDLDQVADVTRVAERLTDQAMDHPDLVQITGSRDPNPLGADGDPEALLTERPSAVQYAAAFTLEAEQALRRLAVVRGAHHLAAADVHAWLDANAPTIGPDQRAAVVGIASCDAALTVLIGPAGTGKSYAAGALAGAWADLTGGRLIGLATSEAATTVLRDDGITHAANVAAFLAATGRLEAGITRPADLAWRLGPTDVVMVDEASMVATKDLDAVRERVQAAGARLVLTGDPHQLAAVAAGGAMDLVSDRAETFTLTEVRRFAEPWEREASLRLRQGDVQALAEYTRHARLISHDSPEDAVQAVARAAVADLVDGREVLAVAGSNALAADVARHMRAMLIDLGRVQDGPATRLGRDDNAAGVGDLVQARRIDRTLGLSNRENYQVTTVGDDGSLEVVSTRTGELRHVPADYVAADMQLAYAATVHAAQGRTVDACHYLTDHRTDVASLYVGNSRGRIRNTAHVISPVIRQDDGTMTRPGPDAVLAQAFTRVQVPQAALGVD